MLLSLYQLRYLELLKTEQRISYFQHFHCRKTQVIISYNPPINFRVISLATYATWCKIAELISYDDSHLR